MSVELTFEDFENAIFALLFIGAVVGYFANAGIRWLEFKLCSWAHRTRPVTEG